MAFVPYYKKTMCFFDQKSDKSGKFLLSYLITPTRIENYSTENKGKKAYCMGIVIGRADSFAH